MAMMKCSECGTEISDKATACPKCGSPIKRKTVGFGTAVIAILVVFFVAMKIDSALRSDYSAVPTAQAAPTPPAAITCDKQAAQKVQLNIDGLAKITSESGYRKVQWGKAFFGWGKDEQLTMAQAAANANACLTGSANDIRFYSPSGKLNAVASPSTGIRLVD